MEADEYERLRRAVFVARLNQPLKLLLYYTGTLQEMVTPLCPEGTLVWKHPSEFEALEIIETTRPVLRLLVKDMNEDPQGGQPVKAGMAVFNPDGKFRGLVWAG